MNDYVLKIDIDGNYDKEEMARRVVYLMRLVKAKCYDVDEKKTEHGYHIKVAFWTDLEITDMELILFQMFLMSDPYREIFNWRRVRNKFKKNWNVLFKRKYVSKDGKLIKVSEEKDV